MSKTAIRLDGIGKQYEVGAQRESYVALRDRLASRFRLGRSDQKQDRVGSASSTFWALRDISFDVPHGQRLGIIGRNGAGKSTLLKIVSRITTPTEGRLGINGKVASLLEVGTGFHPELTGRENVYLNGAILGMSKREIEQKFDEIVAFAEVEQFLETPVKRYSSGMYVRLAFSVAAHMQPDILLVDEVLAVGDARFQKKCLGKMEDVSREGRTVLFVSHNMGAVSELCDRGILLEKGRVAADSDIRSVVLEYSRQSADGATVVINADASRPCSITKLRLLRDGEETTEFDLNDGVTIELTYRVLEPLYQLQMTATLARNGVDVVHSFDTDDSADIGWTQPGEYRGRYTLPPMFLKAGAYSVRVTAGTPETLIQDMERAVTFSVEEMTINTNMRSYRAGRPGMVVSPGRWTTELLEKYPSGQSVSV